MTPSAPNLRPRARFDELLRLPCPAARSTRRAHLHASIDGIGIVRRTLTPLRKGEARNIDPLAGKPAPAAILVNVPRLVTAYYTDIPDAAIPAQRVAFGTSGHRGSAFEKSFNEWHIVAISQAICEYRKRRGINGPLFLGIDTHALSVSAY